MYFHHRPDGFSPKFEIVACWLVRPEDGRLVLLLRPSHKPEPNTWGVPAGKVESGEDPYDAMRRELFEEVGFVLLPEEALTFERTLYVRYPTYEFVYHMYRADVPNGFQVQIHPEEHDAFRWVTPDEALGLPLIQELDACIGISFFGRE